MAILDDDPANVLALLAGSSLAGTEACIYPLAATEQAVADYREKFDHEHLVTSRASLPDAIDSTELLGDAGAPHVAEAPASAPLLVMTSGTTSGQPRAVRHDWSRRAQARAQHRSARRSRGGCSSYGLNQFGGLQILIHVLAAQATLVVADSFQPRDGLAAMRQWGVTHASGTPTFWRFLLVEIATRRRPRAAPSPGHA